MALDDKNILNNKLSSLIEGQVPDFVQADHPLFVNFLKDYYKFLEAGLLTISTTTDYVALETSSSSYVLEETDGDRIVTELGAGSKGYFEVDETITGSTSNATAKVLVDDSRNSRIYITSQQKFITGETITGGTSGSEGVVVEYRANPVQNIQQLLDYADVDNTIYDFLDKMRDSFMVDIPDDLASGISRRNLIKNIKDLYSAKGTSEGHKLFMRMLLGETADIFYPNQYMIKSSGGQWEIEKVLRVLSFENVSGEEVVNQIITGKTSGATAVVVSSLISQQTKDNFNDSVTELTIANIEGTFLDGEVISGVSTVSDREAKFTVFGIVSSVTAVANNDNSYGNLYSKNEIIDIESVGNDLAEVVVDEIESGSVGEVIVDDAGTNYAVGDAITFTANSIDTDAVAATGEISMIGGGLRQESGTLDDSSVTDQNITLEDDTLTTLTPFNFILEEVREDIIYTDGTSTSFTLTNLNANTDTVVVYFNGELLAETTLVSTETIYEGKTATSRDIAITNWSISGNTLTFTEILPVGNLVQVRHSQEDSLLLDRTDSAGTDAGFKIESNTVEERPDLDDAYSRNNIVLEYDTFENLGVTSERGSIQAVRVNENIGENQGYTKLPTLTITTVGGSGGKVVATPNGIGSIKSVKVVDNGFRYTSSNPPDVNFRSHFILKDVSGTFAANNTLTTHSGTVKAWDSTTNELVIQNFDDGQKVVQEQDGTFNEGIQLEQGTELLTPMGFILETEREIPATGFTKKVGGVDVEVEEDKIVLNGTSTFNPYENITNVFLGSSTVFGELTPRVTIRVTAEYNENTKKWAFYLDGKKQKKYVFYEGTEYYFDLSDPSLYGLQSGTPIENLEKSFALSLTSDGTNNSGTRETSNITTTQKYNVDGALDIVRIGGGNLDTLNWSPPANLLDTSMYLWDRSVNNYLTPASFFDPQSPLGLNDKSQYGTSESWTDDELYSIHKGYTGAYLKITIPNNTVSANKYFYYSPNFSDMGGEIVVKRRSKVFKDAGSDIILNSVDKEEYGFILEDASQDRVVGGDSTRATDKLIMEDGRDSVSADDITEKQILKSKPRDSLLTDAEYLVIYYSGQSGGIANTFQEWKNNVAQRYEPTYFMSESYIPPIKFWGTCQPVHAIRFDRKNKGRSVTPTAKEFIEPILKTVNSPTIIPASGPLAGKGGSKLSASQRTNTIAFCGTGDPYFFPKVVHNEDGRLLIDNSRENETEFFLVLDGTDADGSDAGSLIANEDFGNTLILNGTDADGTDARDAILLNDETGDGNIILDATASGVDSGDELLLEADLVYNSRAPITITDSGGATGKIMYIDRAQGVSTVDTVSQKTGAYKGINHLIGEDLIRLQDSYYYQDYSYEVIVGDSLVTYLDELRKAVHPAGFEPFGKVSIATLVSAAVTNTAAGVTDFTGDTTTFSPILASALETIFSQVLQSRLQVPTNFVVGNFDDKIVQETGVLPGENLVLDVTTEFNLVLDGIDSNSTDAGDALVLDGTDGSATDAGDNITVLDEGAGILFEDENLLLELGGDNIVLNGTDDDSTNAGDNIRINAGEGIDLEDGLSVTSTDVFLYEEATVNSTDDITSGTGDAGGRIMSETSYAPSGQADRVIFSTIVKKLESKPLPRFERNLLLYLAETPFGSEPCGITLESGSGNLTDNIILDGQIPFNEGSAFMELERDSEIDNIILDGTDSLGSDAGDGLVLETGFFLKIEDPSLGRESETFRILFEDDGKVQLEASIYAFPVGFRVSDGDKLLLDTLDNEETITLSDIGSLSFSDIRTPDKIEIQGLNANEQNWGGGADDDNITLEDFGQILLDQTQSDGTDAGHHLLQETSKRNRFTLEQSGNLIVEEFSTLSNFAAVELEIGVQDEIGDDLLLEAGAQENIPFNIKLEDDELGEGVIILNGTDASSTDANDKINLEDFFNENPTDYKILLEEHNVFAAEGQIPVAHYTLNSTSVITKGNVRAADISVRDTGDITLEDATDNAEGYLVLNSTSGSSTNAGENIDLEGATGITY